MQSFGLLHDAFDHQNYLVGACEHFRPVVQSPHVFLQTVSSSPTGFIASALLLSEVKGAKCQGG